MLSSGELTVWVDDPAVCSMSRVGALRHSRTRSALDAAFSYDAAWLANARVVLDPLLGDFEGDQRPPRGALFGIFADTTPDRWGRTLLQRREAHAARREGRAARLLDEWDYLVGVRDDLRMGALRLRDDEEFVAPGAAGGIPVFARLRDLQYHADRVENDREASPADEDAETALLLAPGSSLGGARPKGVFTHEDGHPWIAKFPSASDQRDMGAWEYVLNRLAAQCAIPVPETQLLELLGRHRTFCARRFDRVNGQRRLFASAMTLTGKRDGDEASYLDLVEAIEDLGDPRRLDDDLAQLFRRAVFAVLTAHRDDHLRNHGFLHTGRGWTLAPAFDLNPIPEKKEHTLTFDGDSAAPDLDVVRSTAELYRLKTVEADAIVQEVRSALRAWRDVARATKLSRDAIDLMGTAIAA